MSALKIAGGVLAGTATGIAIIVALPVAGAVGTITATGALLSGGLGAATGGTLAALDDSEEQARKQGYRQGQKDTQADYAQRIRDHEDRLARALNKGQESTRYFNGIYAMAAVATACASENGKLSATQREAIEQLINGLASSYIPRDVRQNIDALYQTPPNIREAFHLARASGLDMDVFDEIMAIIRHTSGGSHRHADAFMQAWHTLKAA